MEKHDLLNCPAMRALVSLTPSGSEYVDDIQRCVDTVRYTRDNLMKLLVEEVKKRHVMEKRIMLAERIILELRRIPDQHQITRMIEEYDKETQ